MIIYMTILVFMFSFWNVQSKTASPDEIEALKKDKIVFGFNVVPVKIKRRNLMGAIEYLSLNIDIGTLKHYNITKDQLESGLLVKDAKGHTEIRIPGVAPVPIDLKVDEVIKYKESHGGDAFTLSKVGLMARTMADLTDKSLIPEKHPKLQWSRNEMLCKSRYLKVSSTPSTIEIQLSQNTIASKETHRTPKNNQVWWDGQGLSVIVINPSTCHVTFDQIFATGDFGNFRDLIWALETIRDGSLIVLTSLRDGSLLLGKAVEKLTDMGSFWAPHYLYKDGWINVLYKGGKFLSESMIPHMGVSINQSSSPVQVVIPLPDRPAEKQQSCYSSWPTTAIFENRKNFCESYEGYGRLCSCDNPFVLENNSADKKNSSNIIPLVIIAGKRPRHLYRLIESVGNQKGVGPNSFLIAIDGANQEMLKLTSILQLPTLLHGRALNVSGTARVAANLQFGLFNAHKIYPDSQYFILLEEDLILAPDFYQYMNYLAPIFEMDPSIFCISAFNHLSFPHTSRDPNQIYRVNTMPAYGWMVSRKILEYILPKILPNTINQDWDYFLGSELIRNDREILIPDINRSFHWATAGLHLKGSWLAETHYLSREMNKEVNVSYVPLKSLLKDNYEKEFNSLLQKATILRADAEFNFKPPIEEGKVYAIFVRKYSEEDDWGFRFVGDLLGIWSLDARDHHNHAQRLYYKNATLFIVGVPASPYKIYLPKNGTFISPTNETEYELEVERLSIVYSAIPITNHAKNFNVPSFYTIS